MLKIPQGSKFKKNVAQELLLLVQKAHEEFDKSQTDENWKWDEDRKPIIVGNKEYEVKLRFGFAEYDYFIKNIGSNLGEVFNFNDSLRKALRQEIQIQQLGGVGRKRVPLGLVAYNQNSNAVYVIFRGTMTPAEWITNFQFKPGNDSFLGNNNLGRVHRGFHKIYTRKDIGDNIFTPKDDIPSIKDCIEKAVIGCDKNAIEQWPENAIQKCPKEAQVYITGHSLSGALATLATLHVKEMEYFDNPPILYAFANPRAGGPIFAKQFEKLECFRIANTEDIVPTIPLASVNLKAPNTTDTTSMSLQQSSIVSLVTPLLADLDYHHVGEPLYFTNHKGAIADNHIIPAYKEALDLPI